MICLLLILMKVDLIKVLSSKENGQKNVLDFINIKQLEYKICHWIYAYVKKEF